MPTKCQVGDPPLGGYYIKGGYSMPVDTVLTVGRMEVAAKSRETLKTPQYGRITEALPTTQIYIVTTE
jgi:hypothetical protein